MFFFAFEVSAVAFAKAPIWLKVDTLDGNEGILIITRRKFRLRSCCG